MIKNVTASKVEEIVQSDDVLSICKHHHLQKLHQLKVWLAESCESPDMELYHHNIPHIWLLF